MRLMKSIKPKKKESSRPKPAATEALARASPVLGVGADMAIRRVTLGARHRDLLNRVQRFLVTVQSPIFARVARLVGYDASEHQLGWTLFRRAAGEERSLDEWFLEGRTVQPQAFDTKVLEALDGFENTWFPRTRAIIMRALPPEARGEFAALFFKNLEQQPLGPLVVASVRTFLDRVDGLGASSEEGASEVLSLLTKRGLDDTLKAHVRGLLARAEGNDDVVLPDDSRVAAVMAAQQSQRDAVDQVRVWFNDWATTFRTSPLDARRLLQLGLTNPSRTPPAPEETEEPPPGVPPVSNGSPSAPVA